MRLLVHFALQTKEQQEQPQVPTDNGRGFKRPLTRTGQRLPFGDMGNSNSRQQPRAGSG